MLLHRSFMLGNLRCHSLENGILRLDGGAMFGTVPKTVWNKVYPADDGNQILMWQHSTLICEAPLPARNSTWGQVKSLYR